MKGADEDGDGSAHDDEDGSAGEDAGRDGPTGDEMRGADEGEDERLR